MILLSAQKQPRGVLELTHARLDGTEDDNPTKLVRGIQIELPVQHYELPYESRQEYIDPLKEQAEPQVLEAQREVYEEPKPPKSSLRQDTKRKSSYRVKFQTVQMREHAVVVGDHDWCEDGLPIALDWKHAATRSIAIDDFEWIRERQGRTPRGRLPKLSNAQRKQLLHRVSDITEEDLVAMKQCAEISKYVALRRSKTVTYFPKQH